MASSRSEGARGLPGRSVRPPPLSHRHAMPRGATAQGGGCGSLLCRAHPGARAGGAAGRLWGPSVPRLSEGGGSVWAVLSRCWTRGLASPGGCEIPAPPALPGQSSEGALSPSCAAPEQAPLILEGEPLLSSPLRLLVPSSLTLKQQLCLFPFWVYSGGGLEKILSVPWKHPY